MWAAILAMTILRSANAGSLEELLDNWTSPEELGRWTRLDMSHEELSGTIPDAVGFMTALESLDLSFNSLRGPIPDAVGSLQRLEEFRVGATHMPGEPVNKLSGPIPHAVGAWTRLRTFGSMTTI